MNQFITIKQLEIKKMKKIKVLHLSVDLFSAKGNTTHDDKYFNDVERAEWFLKTWYDTWVWRDGGKNGENIEDCYFSNRDAWIQIKDGRRAEFKLEEMEIK
jgi:hypothetical protein